LQSITKARKTDKPNTFVLHIMYNCEMLPSLLQCRRLATAKFSYRP